MSRVGRKGDGVFQVMVGSCVVCIPAATGLARQVLDGHTTPKVSRETGDAAAASRRADGFFCCVRFSHLVFAEGLSVNQVPLRPRPSVRQTGHPWFALQICGETGESR